MTNSMLELFGEPIHTYTRADAIEDGDLVPMEDNALSEKFKYPVVLTRNAWHTVEVPEGMEGWQDLEGRLHDLGYMAIMASKRHKGAADLVPFACSFQVWSAARKPKTQTFKFWAHCGPGDTAAPVVTIGFPEDF